MNRIVTLVFQIRSRQIRKTPSRRPPTGNMTYRLKQITPMMTWILLSVEQNRCFKQREDDTRTMRGIDNYGDAQPPATSTHSARQLPCLPSTSTMSVSHRHRQPTPFSLTGSGFAQYSSSSIRSFSSSVVFSRNGCRGNCRAGALAGQCWIVV